MRVVLIVVVLLLSFKILANERLSFKSQVLDSKGRLVEGTFTANIAEKYYDQDEKITYLSVDKMRFKIGWRTYKIDGDSDIDHFICVKIKYPYIDYRYLGGAKYVKRPFTVRYNSTNKSIPYVYIPDTRLNGDERIYWIDKLVCADKKKPRPE